MIEDQKIFVAGGTGLVGANLTRRLSQLGSDVRSSYHSRRPPFLEKNYIQVDFLQFDDCRRATRGVETVFLCAAERGGAKTMKEGPSSQILPNLKIMGGLFEACRINQVKKVVLISSSTVYQESFHPLREDELDLNLPPFKLYLGVGWLNRYFEQLAVFYQKKYAMEIAIFRPTSLYGPFDCIDEGRSNVLPSLIHRALRKENPFVVWGDGRAVRDFVFIDDFVDLLVDVLNKGILGDPLNVATGVPTSVKNAVQAVLFATRHDGNPVFDASKPTAVPYRMLDSTKLKTFYGDRRWTSLEKGLKKTAEWAESQMSVTR